MTRSRTKTVPTSPAKTVPVDTDRRARNIANLPKQENGKPRPPVKVDVTDKKAAQNPRGSILEAFGQLGGTRWLVKLAKRYPKDFASLLAKAMPQDINVTGFMGYAAVPIPVETREPIPGQCVDITPIPIAALEELDPFT